MLLAAVALPMSVSTSAQGQTACVFDLMGSQGDTYAMARDFVLEAKREGINMVLKPYMSEAVAFEDFKAGQCDAVIMTGLRGRQFNAFTGSLDSLGAMPAYEHVKKVLTTL
ncbi:MAG TPA: putative solute-binding protein, partial [Moraxellaceae bacterium]